jgi:hypothetical protein
VAQNCDPVARDVSDLVWTMAYRFLTNFGTKFKDESMEKIAPPLKTLQGMLDAYSGIVLDKEVLAKIKHKKKDGGGKQWLIGQGFGTRDLNQHLQDYVKYNNYFVNEHHRQLFKQVCPNLYGWLFTKQFQQPGMMMRTLQANDPQYASVYLELDKLRWCQRFIKSLAQLEVLPEQKTAFNVPPAGKFKVPGSGASLKVRGDLGVMGLL